MIKIYKNTENLYTCNTLEEAKQFLSEIEELKKALYTRIVGDEDGVILDYGSYRNFYFVIENWNKVVKNKKDRVYVLGDFCLEKSAVIREILPKLKGEIILIGGNHDDLPCSREWLRQGIPILGSLSYHHLLFTHIPIHPSQFYPGVVGNVHGHIHLPGDFSGRSYIPEQIEDPRYYNVNVEFHNYQLVPIEEIDEYYRKLYKK